MKETNLRIKKFLNQPTAVQIHALTLAAEREWFSSLKTTNPQHLYFI